MWTRKARTAPPTCFALRAAFPSSTFYWSVDARKVAAFLVAAAEGSYGLAKSANSRTMLARIAPPSRMTEFFGLYALSGEATAFVAPIAVAIATSASGSQQWGMAVIVAFLALGFIGLFFVREERVQEI